MVSVADAYVPGMWAADLILAQDDWEIRLCVGHFDTERSAERAANKASAALVVVGGEAAMTVTLFGERQVLTADQMDISVLTATAKERLGQPLDVRDSNQRAIAVEALMSRDPSYTVEESDFEPVLDKQVWLAQLLARYREGYKPDHIGLGTRWMPLQLAPDDDDLAVIVATGEELPASLREDLLLEDIAERAIEDSRRSAIEDEE